jgi:hypothetical protein
MSRRWLLGVLMSRAPDFPRGISIHRRDAETDD